MHCPTCNKTLAPGTKCPKCGKLAVASSSDEIDLMPLEEPKKTSASDFAPPPEAFLPPPPMPGKGKKTTAPAEPGQEQPAGEPMRIRAGAMAPKASNMNKIIGGAVLLLLLLFISWRMLRTENKIIGSDMAMVDNKTFTIQPNGTLLRNIEVSGKINWTFEVTATDDTVSVGVVQRSAKEPQTIVALKKLPETYDVVKKGETHPASGEFKTGTYSWVVMNENKKAVRVKVKFKAQP